MQKIFYALTLRVFTTYIVLENMPSPSSLHIVVYMIWYIHLRISFNSVRVEIYHLVLNRSTIYYGRKMIITLIVLLVVSRYWQWVHSACT